MFVDELHDAAKNLGKKRPVTLTQSNYPAESTTSNRQYC